MTDTATTKLPDELDPRKVDAPTFGAIDEDVRPDLTPVPFKVVGYDADQEPHEFVFRARAQAPMGSLILLLQGIDGKGLMDVAAVQRFLMHSLIPEDTERWTNTLDDPGLYFDAQAIVDLGEWLGERYAGRPLAPRSVRRAGSRSTGSGRAAGSRARRASTSGR